MGPDQPPTKFAGVEKAQMLGDLWLLCEGRCEMPGGGMMESRMTVGFDPRKKRFVGTWIGTPMAYMFVYEGELSADGRQLPLTTPGPSFTDPSKTDIYQDVLEIQGPDARALYAQLRRPDGSWQRFMTARYTRVK
jgi:hypothetical protein